MLRCPVRATVFCVAIAGCVTAVGIIGWGITPVPALWLRVWRWLTTAYSTPHPDVLFWTFFGNLVLGVDGCADALCQAGRSESSRIRRAVSRSLRHLSASAIIVSVLALIFCLGASTDLNDYQIAAVVVFAYCSSVVVMSMFAVFARMTGIRA